VASTFAFNFQSKGAGSYGYYVNCITIQDRLYRTLPTSLKPGNTVQIRPQQAGIMSCAPNVSSVILRLPPQKGSVSSFPSRTPLAPSSSRTPSRRASRSSRSRMERTSHHNRCWTTVRHCRSWAWVNCTIHRAQLLIWLSQ
jgi:hypothetical protein